MLLIALFPALCLLAAGAIVADGLHDEIAPADVAIVLGSKVQSDGTPSRLPGGNRQRSLSMGLKGYSKNPSSVLLGAPEKRTRDPR